MDNNSLFEFRLSSGSFAHSAMLTCSTHLDLRIQLSNGLSMSVFTRRLIDGDKLHESRKRFAVASRSCSWFALSYPGTGPMLPLSGDDSLE